MTQLTLHPVTRDNWIACAKLEVPESQRGYVAPNVYSIAESKFEPHYQPRVILLDEEVAGFLMYCQDDTDQQAEAFWLFRMMIAASHQGKGLGYQAVTLALAEMETMGARLAYTMHKPDNEVAGRLYARLGFRRVGMLEDGDIQLQRDF